MVDIHTIAAVKGKENYESISVCFKDCFESINKLKRHPELSINGKVYKLELFLGCDYKVS